VRGGRGELVEPYFEGKAAFPRSEGGDAKKGGGGPRPATKDAANKAAAFVNKKL